MGSEKGQMNVLSLGISWKLGRAVDKEVWLGARLFSYVFALWLGGDVLSPGGRHVLRLPAVNSQNERLNCTKPTLEPFGFPLSIFSHGSNRLPCSSQVRACCKDHQGSFLRGGFPCKTWQLVLGYIVLAVHFTIRKASPLWLTPRNSQQSKHLGPVMGPYHGAYVSPLEARNPWQATLRLLSS